MVQHASMHMDHYTDGGKCSVADPVFIGSGRLFFAPVEDVLFGFAMILLILAVWMWLGRRGVQRTPFSGPPRWRAPAEAEG